MSSTPVVTQLASGFDGNPLSIISFLFSGDPIPWAIIANQNAMAKQRPGYYQNLGIDPPTVAATATAGGSGNLNSSGGVGYDWRYTYYNEVTQSESNGSPINTSGTPDVVRPTFYIDPDPTIGGNPFQNPLAAIDSSPTSFSQGTAPTPLNTIGMASCQWGVWGSSAGQYSALVLTVVATGTTTEINPNGPINNPGGGTVEYSLDSGVTWATMTANNSGQFTASIPPSTALANILVRASVSGSSAHVSGGVSRNFESLQVFDIYTTGTLVTSTSANTLSLTNQSAKVCCQLPADKQVTAIRLYREGGTLPQGVWNQVGTFEISSLVKGSCGVGSVEIDDNSADTVIQGNNILLFDNNHPVSSVQANDVNLPVIWGPFPEAEPRVLGCGDPARPSAVYFSKVGNADEWPPQNWVNVGPPAEPAQNGAIYSTRCYVFTTETCYMLLAGIDPNVTFTPFKTAVRHGLYAKFALCVGAKGIYFVSKDGVYLTDGGPETNIVADALQPLFPKQEGQNGQDVSTYRAPDFSQPLRMRLVYHNGEIWFGYIAASTGERDWMIYDEVHTRWRSAVHNPELETVYDEPSVASSLLMGGSDGALYQGGGPDDDGNPISTIVRTGAFDQGMPLKVKEYGNVLLDIDPGGGALSIAFFINGTTLVTTVPIPASTGRQQVNVPLNDTLARNISFEITWTNANPILYQLTIMYRPSATAMTHWELPPTSHGLSGVQHVLDVYVSCRTNAPVNFTVTSDITGPMSFTIPNSNNQKQKVYIPMLANKGRLYKYQFDSQAPFQIYQPETEIRSKQWNTALGYQVIPALGAELPPPETDA